MRPPAGRVGRGPGWSPGPVLVESVAKNGFSAIEKGWMRDVSAARYDRVAPLTLHGLRREDQPMKPPPNQPDPALSPTARGGRRPGGPVVRAPRRMAPGEDGGAVLALIRAAFAGMDGRIDPPSSARRLDLAAVARQAAEGEVWLIEDHGAVLAAVFLTPLPGRLYIGKLAVAAGAMRQGMGRRMLDHAAARARVLGLPVLELQARVELVENHDFFRACGFVQTAATAHPGYGRATSLTFTRRLDVG